MMFRVEIPDKPTFKIGEVAKLLGIEAYVLRYWETEFEQLRPKKTTSGQRQYVRADIDMLLRIRRLLYEQMYTIAGARRQLEHAPQDAGMRTLDAAQLDAFESERASLLQTTITLRQELDAERAERLHLELERANHERDAQQFLRDREEFELKMERIQKQLKTQAIQGDEEANAKWNELTEQLTDQKERLERELEEYRHQILDLIAQRDQLEARHDEMGAKLRLQRQGRKMLIESLRREVHSLGDIAKRA